MSVSIRWRPTKDIGKGFDCGGSREFASLKEAFGSTIGPEDVRALRAMAIATKNEFYNKVADVVDNVGEIEVFGVY